MNFIDKLEKKFPRFGITNLMKYVICINIAGTVIQLIDMSGMLPISIYSEYLSLDFYKILHGQVWRIFSFVLHPTLDSGGLYGTSRVFIDILWFAIWAFVYYQIGMVLEREWGKFRFTLFYLSGVFFVIITTLVFYLVYGSIAGADIGVDASEYLGYMIGSGATLSYLNETLFLAFALMFPDTRFFLYFLIPVKAKWLAFVYLGLMAFSIVRCIMYSQYYALVLTLGALVNFAIFFIFARGSSSVKGAYTQKKRRKDFEKKANSAWSQQRRPHEASAPTGGARHKCAICGRTELDDPKLEFRYCSKCNGNYEYCSDHLFSHTHVSG